MPERHFGDPIEDGRVDFRNVYPVVGVDFAVDRVGGCPHVSHVVALSSADYRVLPNMSRLSTFRESASVPDIENFCCYRVAAPYVDQQ